MQYIAWGAGFAQDLFRNVPGVNDAFARAGADASERETQRGLAQQFGLAFQRGTPEQKDAIKQTVKRLGNIQRETARGAAGLFGELRAEDSAIVLGEIRDILKGILDFGGANILGGGTR